MRSSMFISISAKCKIRRKKGMHVAEKENDATERGKGDFLPKTTRLTGHAITSTRRFLSRENWKRAWRVFPGSGKAKEREFAETSVNGLVALSGEISDHEAQTRPIMK